VPPDSNGDAGEHGENFTLSDFGGKPGTRSEPIARCPAVGTCKAAATLAPRGEFGNSRCDTGKNFTLLVFGARRGMDNIAAIESPSGELVMQ